MIDKLYSVFLLKEGPTTGRKSMIRVNVFGTTDVIEVDGDVQSDYACPVQKRTNRMH